MSSNPMVHAGASSWRARRTGEIAPAATRRVYERARIDLIDDAVLPPGEARNRTCSQHGKGIFVYKQLVENPESYYREICRFIGVDEDEGWRISRGQRENEGWTEKQIQKLRAISASPWRSTRYRWLSQRQRRQWLGLGASDGSPRYRPEMSEAALARVNDRFRAEYRVVMERWSVPLDRYGYPV